MHQESLPKRLSSEQKLPALFNLTGRVAVVTGGAGLLGEEFCCTLVQAGAKVVIADIDALAAKKVSGAIERLVSSVSHIGDETQNKALPSAVPFETNVTDPTSVQNMVSATLQAFGRLDILVNCAALDPKFDPEHTIGRQTTPPSSRKKTNIDLHTLRQSTAERQSTALRQSTAERQSTALRQSTAERQSTADEYSQAFENFPLEAWNQALAVNLTGVFLCCQAAVKPMLLQGSGVIVNLSSIYGLVAPDQRMYQQSDKTPQYKPAYYTVTKFGILGLTQYLATYYAGKNIRVNAISPGGVYNGHDDDFVKAYSARSVLGRMAEKDEINGALLFLVSDASKYMTGANLIIDGGWTAW